MVIIHVTLEISFIRSSLTNIIKPLDMVEEVSFFQNLIQCRLRSEHVENTAYSVFSCFANVSKEQTPFQMVAPKRRAEVDCNGIV